MSEAAPLTDTSHDDQDVWRALSNPVRRLILDFLGESPRTTGEIDHAIPTLSRFAVMQHLGVLTDAGLVVVRRRGRHRINHLNPVPLREWYERWVSPLADMAATEGLALRRHIDSKGPTQVRENVDQFRTVRIESELRFEAPPERVFSALTEESLDWFPHTYGEDRVKAVVVEPKVGGAHYEDWGDGMGHLYGHVTVYDPPHRFHTRGRLMPGTILDSFYDIEADGAASVLKMSKVAVGPMTDEEAASIQTYGDLLRFEDALRAVVER